MKSRIGVTGVTLALWLTAVSAEAQEKDTRTLAINTFKSHAKDAKNEWMGEALADMLTTDIAATGRIRVINRREVKEIVGSQKESYSAKVDDKDNIALGKMVGARLLLVGTYNKMAKELRLDAQVFDIEKGTIEAAASVSGTEEDLMVLEKQLAGKVLESLKIQLSEKERLELLQLPTRQVRALELNYRGVLAKERKDSKAATELFSEAVAQDPYYRDAKDNYNMIVAPVEGKSLFSGAVAELEQKKRQLGGIKAVVEDFQRKFYEVQLSGEPQILTKAADATRVGMRVCFTVEGRTPVARSFIEQLKRLAGGPKPLELKLDEGTTERLQLFPESYDFLYWKMDCGWAQDVSAQLMDSDVVRRKHEFVVRLNTRSGLYAPETSARGEVNREGSRQFCLEFRDLPLDEVKKITAVRFVSQ